MKKTFFIVLGVLALLMCDSCTKNRVQEQRGADTVQLIRNATLKIDYAGQTILVDPLFSEKGEL